jgi:tRNA threonylcarbamoyladenosine biosynthesis protein TsaB
MILGIDTSNNKEIIIFLEKNGQVLKRRKVSANRNQSEKLLPLIEETFKKNNFKFKDLKEIKVANRGESFTSLRIGILTANALAYALKIKVSILGDKVNKKYIKNFKDFNIVIPDYTRDPDIIISKKNV